MEEKIWDIAVIGCGPAGLSAAINARIRNREILVFGTEVCSPSLQKAPKIINYPGFPSITGEDLRQRFLEHATTLGIEITRKKIDNIYSLGNEFGLMSKQEMFRAKSVIITTGIAHPVYLPGEREFLGKGLGYCATCDGPFFRGKDVAIIAYNAEAEADARYLTEICQRVYYLPLYQEIGNLGPDVEVVNDKPKQILGEATVQGIQLEKRIIPVDGVFIVGSEVPPERLVPGVELVDGHYKVNRDMQTNIPGLFAAGDCTGRPYQLAKAVGEGQVAGLAASKYVVDAAKIKSFKL